MPGIPPTHSTPRCLLRPWVWSSFLQGNLGSHGSWGCEREWESLIGRGPWGLENRGDIPPPLSLGSQLRAQA